MRVSLRNRLLAPLLVLLAGDFVATGAAAWVAAHDAQQRIDAQLQSVAHTLTEPPSFPLTIPVLEKTKALSGADFLLIRPDGGRVTTLGETDAAPETRTDEFQILKLPLRPPHPNEGGTLYIFYPESQRRTAAWDAARPLLWLGGAGGLVGGLLVVFVSRRLVDRIGRLNQHTRIIAAGDFRPMPLPRQNDELRDLCQAVNDMADRLAANQTQLQELERLRILGQFSGGLAHQLRNAATGARLAIELHSIECPTTDRESLDVALRQLTRMESNLRQFLELGKLSHRTEPCDLMLILTESVTLLRPQCQHIGTALVWEAPPAMPFVGDPVQLGHLFLNVIGNAIEAAGPRGTVTVTTSTERDVYRVEVMDTGPGPPPHLAARLFEAFVTGKEQGIGLGLAVAKQAVEHHNGAIGWERDGDKTVFRITLPRPESARG